ncbi:putative oxidoreductase [Helianthus annuus]|uniref:Oxidoreductase n=1 Tax=Helianthus annuus TaxID=4232 RepID=A0A1Y3BUK2_HELAN|nr:carotenoid cleavage dioxygenase 8 homolog B, chloroplastic [Helianthus annuus]KAF5823925.1 putative oxidoreductase [Helianthus annuus]KAJ0624914.1 putative oxidoreductase [Helianthus annuus]KAJ0628584.1 putative oxidoreductase [Helianthus annuus]KAJ0784913.1 putative oxidoreductase [Helianthus annuus]KAJ0794169.1 putative oxidoreductase [Helianthus annuus]
MAFSLSYSAIGNYGLRSCMAVANRDSDGTFGQAMFQKISKSRESSKVSVATDFPPVVVQQPPWRDQVATKERKLAAWTSVRQDRWEGELVVEGEIPQWLNGTYLRNGPGLWHIGDYNFRHLFDGYATIVRLHFENGRLVMAHRQIESDAYKAARKNNKLCYREFSEVPKHDNFLAYIGDLANLFSGASLTDNANTGVVQLGDGRVVCLTETIKGSIVINPNNLETLGKFEYSDSLGTLVHSAHPIVTASEFLTLLPDLLNPGYQVVRMEPGSNERKVIGRVDCRGGPSPGWVHSFPVTEHYVVVPEMPLRYCAQNLLRAEPTPLYKFEWHPESKGFMHVMCKASGKLVASVEVPLFVTFHYINAYEDKDEDGRVTGVIVDCCEHNANPAILDKLRLQNLRSWSGDDVLPDARVGRFKIPLDGSPNGELVDALNPDEHGRGMDMCSINPAYLGKKYRYAYACGAQRPCNFPNTITKIDFEDKKAKSWYDEGSVPSEPFFVARPGATKEDDGVVISMVSDKNGEGYALILDASSFEEIARAKFPYGLPYGLHGCWVPKC